MINFLSLILRSYLYFSRLVTKSVIRPVYFDSAIGKDTGDVKM